MAIPPVDVPNVPGIPPVLFLNPLAALPSLLVADAVGLFLGYAPQIYGIFSQAGMPVVICDSIITVEYKQEFVLSTFPMEQGAFNTYDKVQTPYDARLRCATGGSPAARQAFLASIDAIIGDINLYSIVTPDKVYTSANIIHQDYKRAASSGAGLLQVDIFLEEVRVTGSATTTSTQSSLPASTPNYKPSDPANSQPSYNGPVQPSPGPTIQMGPEAPAAPEAPPQQLGPEAPVAPVVVSPPPGPTLPPGPVLPA